MCNQRVAFEDPHGRHVLGMLLFLLLVVLLLISLFFMSCICLCLSVGAMQCNLAPPAPSTTMADFHLSISSATQTPASDPWRCCATCTAAGLVRVLRRVANVSELVACHAVAHLRDHRATARSGGRDRFTRLPVLHLEGRRLCVGVHHGPWHDE